MNLRQRLGAARSDRSTRDSGWALANEVTTLVSMTAAFMLLSRSLGTVGYGEYASMFALAGPATAFATAGVTLTVFEHAVRLREAPRSVAHSCLSITTLIGLIATAALTLVSRWTIPKVSVTIVIAFFLAELVLAGWTLSSAAVVQATKGFAPATRMRMTVSGTRIVLLAVMEVTGTLDLRNLSAAWLLTMATLAILNTILAGRALGGGPVRPGRFSADHLRSTGLYSFGISAVNVQNDGDKVALTAANHLTDAGLYSAAYRIVQLGLMPINAVASATHLSFLDTGRTPGELVARARKLSLASFSYGLFFGGVVALAAPLVPRVLGDDFAGTETIMRALIPLVVVKGIGTFPMNALLGLGRNRLRTTILLVNSAWSVLLYVLLVPTYSWKGAAIATAVAESTLAAASWIAVLRARRTARPDAEDLALAIATEEAETIAGAAP